MDISYIPGTPATAADVARGSMGLKPPDGQTFGRMQPGRQLGTSPWVTVTQPMIDGFGAATLDRDPMHVDPDWAAAGPFGGTIGFGFLTMSLLTHMLHRAMGTDSSHYDPAAGYFLNYGFDRVRLVEPVTCGARVRGTFSVGDVRPDAAGRSIVGLDARIEIEDCERPALVARWLTVWVPPTASS